MADLLVVFASFLNFHPSVPPATTAERQRSHRILRQMLRQFERDPQTVLKAFWKNCDWLPRRHSALLHQLSSPSFNPQFLLSDLRDLDRSLLCADLLAQCPSLLLLQGKQDRIVHPQQAQVLLQTIRQTQAPRVELHLLDGPHALPATQPASCWEVVRSHLSCICEAGVLE